MKAFLGIMGGYVVAKICQWTWVSRIELLNLAMLTRQAWFILQNLEALGSRILNELYFLANEFLYATIGSPHSHVWRELVEGRDVIKQGLIKQIGMGVD